MRKLLLVLLIAGLAVVMLYRERLFLRDPLGKLYFGRTEVAGAEVFINYSNDVLVMRNDGTMVMVQGWDRTPGMPRHLACFRTVACWTEKDEAEKVSPATQAGYEPRTAMSSREVTYADAGGAAVRVVIR